MTIQTLMESIIVALPEHSNKLGRKTIREVSLELFEDGGWQVLAGGHSAVHIGEWGGDFEAHGNSPQEALINCLRSIKAAQ